MKMHKLVIAAVAVACLPAVALAQKVTTDHDPSAPFATYKTYLWADGTAAPNPLSEKRIREGVDTKMAAAGFKLVTASPDVVVATHVVGKEQKQLSATGYGGYGYGRWGGGGGTATVYTYVQGTLVVDLYDGKTKELVWRGTATDTMSDKPEKNAEKVAKAIDKLFKAYPPKPKK
jgi:hypothetical protein